jgi:flagellar assembly factor FliW
LASGKTFLPTGGGLGTWNPRKSLFLPSFSDFPAQFLPGDGGGMGFAQRAQRLNTNMITAELTEPVTRETKGTGIIRLPFGLLGFEHVKQYVLLTNPAEEPFMWFQMLDDAKRAFLVAPPARLVPDYEPDISEDEVDFLELADPSDAFLLNIVTLRGNGQATVNLKGPVVINRRTLIGKQVILNNAAQYSLHHPLAAS